MVLAKERNTPGSRPNLQDPLKASRMLEPLVLFLPNPSFAFS